MTDYFSLYSKLFNGITDALKHLEDANYGLAKDCLISAQKETEKLYIEKEQ